MKQAPKYHNVKTLGYDSAKEAERARVLHLMEKAGKIRDLREQVRFELIPVQREGDAERRLGINPSTILPTPAKWSPSPASKGGSTRGNVIERAAAYVADFVYVDANTGETVVEDVKGVRTDAYVLKRKMMLWFYGIRVREV